MNTSLLHYAFNMRGMDYCGCEYKGNTIHIKFQFRKEEILQYLQKARRTVVGMGWRLMVLVGRV